MLESVPVHITAGGISAMLVGSVYGLIKLVTWLVQRGKPLFSGIGASSEPEAHSLASQQGDEIHTMFVALTEQKIQWEYLRADIRDIRTGVSKIDKLIDAQHDLTEKTSQLIGLMERQLLKD